MQRGLKIRTSLIGYHDKLPIILKTLNGQEMMNLIIVKSN